MLCLPHRSFALIALIASLVCAQQQAEIADTLDQALYFHPILAGVTLLMASQKLTPFGLQVTYEKSLQDGNSLAIQPQLAIGKIKDSTTYAGTVYHAPDISVTQVTIQATLRHYFNGQQARGWYFAPGVRAGLGSASRPAEVIDDVQWYSASISYFGVGAIGFIGYRGKLGNLTTYSDVGIGYEYVKLLTSSSSISSYSASGLLMDLNLGMGFAF